MSSTSLGRTLLIVALAGLAGCTYTRPLDLADPAGRQRLTERAARQEATVTVQGELPVMARALSVRADSSTWIDPLTGRARTVASSDLEAVRFSTTHPHPASAFLKGLVGGIAVGTAVGYLAYDGPGWFVSSRTDSVLLAGTAFGILGGGVGGLVSLDRLSPERFVVRAAPSE